MRTSRKLGTVAMGLVASAGLAVVASPAMAGGEVAFSNMPAGYQTGIGNEILRGADQNPNQPARMVAMDFVAEASGGITEIMVQLEVIGNTPDDFTVRLHEDNFGEPGNVMGEWNTQSEPTWTSTITADGSVEVSQGETYWLSTSVGNLSWARWRRPVVDDPGTRAERETDGDPWEVRSFDRAGFQIEVDNENNAFSNLVASDFVFNASGGLATRGPDASTLQAWAAFHNVVPSVSGGVTEIRLAMHHGSSDNIYWFQIREDKNGEIGDVLAEWDAPSDTNVANLPVTIEADGSFELTEGETYWMGILPGNNSNGTWRSSLTHSAQRWAWQGPDPWRFFSNSPMGGMHIVVGEGEPPCIADWNGDGEVDVNDFFAYLGDFEAGDPRADLNNDGEIDINDFFIFLSEFEAGC